MQLNYLRRIISVSGACAAYEKSHTHGLVQERQSFFSKLGFWKREIFFFFFFCKKRKEVAAVCNASHGNSKTHEGRNEYNWRCLFSSSSGSSSRRVEVLEVIQNVLVEGVEVLLEVLLIGTEVLEMALNIIVEQIVVLVVVLQLVGVEILGQVLYIFFLIA